MNDSAESRPAATPGMNNDAALQASRALAIEAARVAHDRHLREITVLELADRSPVAKHFVIGTGTSAQQIRAVGSEIAELGKEHGFQVFGKSGLQEGRWVVVDFVDLVVHLFDEEFRQYYDLELLWGDCPQLAWQRDENELPPHADTTEHA